MSNFKDPNGSIFALLNHSIGKVFFKSRFFRQKIINFGEIANFESWLNDEFDSSARYVKRENLWDLVIKNIHNQTTIRDLHCIEFGVAWGYLTKWWLSRKTISIAKWDGFDLFTGLPTKWRFHEEGTFDAGGKPPNICDDRIVWHIGNVKDTINELDLKTQHRKIIFFDFDLFEPTLIAWNAIQDSLRIGDILYFDEAYAKDERQIITEYVLPNHNLKFIGATTTAIAFEYLSRKDYFS